MYNNILIPVMLGDSRDTQSAFKAAQALAETGAQITLLHVIETVPVYVSEYFPPDFITTARDTCPAAVPPSAKARPVRAYAAGPKKTAAIASSSPRTNRS